MSLYYESDLHKIVRGEANAEIEFGNSLLVTEQSDGVIVDYALLRDASPRDARPAATPVAENRSSSRRRTGPWLRQRS